MDKFWCYWISAGLIQFIWEHWLLNFSKNKQKREDLIADTAWNVGLSREELKNIFYIIVILFGGILLPYAIIKRTVKLLINED